MGPARDVAALTGGRAVTRLDFEIIALEASGEAARAACDGKMTHDGVVEVSQIFEWYNVDFEPDGGVVAFINKYGADAPADAKVEYIPYDWTLIAQPGRGP